MRCLSHGWVALGLLLASCSLVNRPNEVAEDPCAEIRDRCDALASCNSEAEPARCECSAGYLDVHGDGTLCQDRDECKGGDHDCDPLAACANDPGGYTCSCPAGYSTEDEARTCRQIDECRTSDNDCDPATQDCFDLEGPGHECRCRSGFMPRANGGCDDVDECAEGGHECVPPARCDNVRGGYACSCPGGLQPIGTTMCEGIDPCVLGMHECGERTRCVAEGSDYRCDCVAGYARRGGSLCQDIDECANDPCRTDARCENLDGSFACRCPGYFDLDADGLGCVDRRFDHAELAGTPWQVFVRVDASGNRFVIGSFHSELEICGQRIVPVGQADVFVAKLGAAGDCWLRTFGGAGPEEALGAAIDPEGNPVLTANYYGGFDVCGMPATDSGGHHGRLVAKLDGRDGSAIWVSSFLNVDPDALVEFNPLHALATDRDGNVLWAGRIAAGADELASRVHVGAVVDWDGMLAKLDARDGSVTWWRRFGGGGQAAATGVAVDPEGEVLVSGFFRPAIAIGDQTLAGLDRWEGFVAKFSAGGVLRWRQQVEGNLESEAIQRLHRLAVGATSTGDVIVGGTYSGVLAIGSASIESVASRDIFVGGLRGATGEPIWLHGFGGAYDEWFAELTVDGEDRIAIAGNYYGEIDFGEGALMSRDWDVYVASFDAAGSLRWAQRFGGELNEYSVGLGVGPGGELVVSAVFTPPVSFADQTITSLMTIESLVFQLRP